ncbi:TIGR03619 family F420-dependent LLM class oxidoreductase [Kibdelosporangium philippinense]|uniref:TIGR03619 family F420-dependent LLM class oxidoreductase n=1 Tax=Kibdelosporangium philippinense TaxID=211113 RepID=A0ABS8ZEU3_9PSEU|nr:TIGR03619 family F420-dependent LLM class oxidoreductase [Kibdelosporangium philippinense]MCE7005216.1 TIGR03619 family F420-dependent LLM class oxidoreductase [Kibdelosporangium philippinense]
MKFTVAIALSPLDQITELARTAQECGYSAIALPDSIFYPEKVAEDYPYTPDGSRFWNAETPWVDPFVAAAAMGAVTDEIRFYTQVLKLGPRNPLLLARQVQSVACLTNNRFGLGVGIGWTPEEFEWCGAPFENRGARVDESIEVLKLVLGGGMVEYHGRFFDFDKLQMSPAPSEPVPFYVGGHTERGLRRAAKIGDGWSSAMIKFDDLKATIERLAQLRAEYERAAEPFEIQAVCIDRFGIDGYRQQSDIGVTDALVAPWVFYGVGMDGELNAKKDGIKRFADEILHKL